MLVGEVQKIHIGDISVDPKLVGIWQGETFDFLVGQDEQWPCVKFKIIAWLDDGVVYSRYETLIGRQFRQARCNNVFDANARDASKRLSHIVEYESNLRVFGRNPLANLRFERPGGP